MAAPSCDQSARDSSQGPKWRKRPPPPFTRDLPPTCACRGVLRRRFERVPPNLRSPITRKPHHSTDPPRCGAHAVPHSRDRLRGAEAGPGAALPRDPARPAPIARTHTCAAVSPARERHRRSGGCQQSGRALRPDACAAPSRVRREGSADRGTRATRRGLNPTQSRPPACAPRHIPAAL